MSQKQKIVITITPDGYKVEAAGFHGGKCLVEEDALEAFIAKKGIQSKGRTQKKKLEQMYNTAPGEKVNY